MIIMLTNNTGFEAGLLFGKFPDRLAHLHSVDSLREPKLGIRWAMDNGVFGAFKNGREWSEEPLYDFLESYSNRRPMWVVVPDWVGDRSRTLSQWDKHWRAVQSFGVKLAFAVQDGMTKTDVPKEADVVFVGGSTSWKWANLDHWTGNFKRVHVGRVNTAGLLERAEKSGAESCDGTGWFRHPDRWLELEKYLNPSLKRKIFLPSMNPQGKRP